MIGAMAAVHSGTTTLCDDTNVAERVSQDPPVSAVTLFAFWSCFNGSANPPRRKGPYGQFLLARSLL
jgi:hypothetical protein